MGPDLLTRAPSPAQATHGDKDRFNGADLWSGARDMLRKCGRRPAERVHRSNIRSQDPRSPDETRSSRTTIIKRGKEETGKGYKEESMDLTKKI